MKKTRKEKINLEERNNETHGMYSMTPESGEKK